MNKYKNNKQKICPKCKILKNFTEYGKSSKRLDGLQPYCKECRKFIANNNKIKLNEYSKNYRKTKKYKEFIMNYEKSEKGKIRKLKNKNYKYSLKIKAFNVYGGCVCSCCGETEISFLVIDHINGGGTKHRKNLSSGSSIYTWLKQNNYPDGFRVLCHNCNWGIYLNNGICPHKKND